MSTSKPSSATATSRPPKPPTTISSSAIISDSASLTGTHRITIGSNAVIHPRCKLISTYGPVTIGAGCIISERCVVGFSGRPVNGSPPNQGEGRQQQQQNEEVPMQMELQDGVVVEIGAKVEARRIGEGTHVGVNCRIGRGAVIGKYVKLGPLSVIEEGQEIGDNTVLYSSGERRIDHHDIVAREMAMRGKHVDVLRGLVVGNATKWRSD